MGLLLLAGLVLAGCTPTDHPTSTATTPAPSTTTATATTSAPTPTAKPVYKPATANGPAQNVPIPVLPAKAKEFSKTGLEEFARYWYSTLGYAFETGDSTPMMAVSVPDCRTCANINVPVGKWYDKGGWITGGRMVVFSSTSTFSETADGTYQAILMIQQTQASYYNPDKSLKHAYAPTAARADILVATYDRGHWTAQTAEHLSGE